MQRHGTQADFIRSAVSRHGTDGLNGTEDTVTTSEDFLKATAILHGMRLRELQAQEICMTLPTEATMRQ